VGKGAAGGGTYRNCRLPDTRFTNKNCYGKGMG
jgi:hypothetical protein